MGILDPREGSNQLGGESQSLPCLMGRGASQDPHRAGGGSPGLTFKAQAGGMGCRRGPRDRGRQTGHGDRRTHLWRAGLPEGDGTHRPGSRARWPWKLRARCQDSSRGWVTTGGLGPLPSAQGNPWPALARTKGPLPSPGRPLPGPQSALRGPCPAELPLVGSPPQAWALHTRPTLPSEPSVFTPPAIRGLQTRAPRGPRQLPAYFPVLRQQDGAGQLGLLLPAPARRSPRPPFK